MEKHDARFFVRHVLVNRDNVDLVLEQAISRQAAIHLPSPRSLHRQQRCRRCPANAAQVFTPMSLSIFTPCIVAGLTDA